MKPIVQWKRFFFCVGVLLLVGLSAWGLTVVRRSSASLTPLRTVPLTRGDLVLSVPATGVVTAAFSVEIKAKASGEILNIHAAEGARVEKGDLLIEIDPKIEEIAIRRAKADLQAAEAGVKKGEVLLQRARLARLRNDQLHEKGFLSNREQEEARQEEVVREADLALAHAERLRAKEALFEAEERRRQTRVVAPRAGAILSLYVKPGQIISSGTASLSQGTLLAILGDLSRLQIDAEIDETDAGRVAVGQVATVHLDAFPGRTFRARVAQVAPAARMRNDLAVVGLQLDLEESDEGMRPGLTANAEIVTERRSGVRLLPRAGVRKEGDRWGVLIVQGEKVSFQEVKVGATDGEQVEIVTDLPDGTEVVIEGGPSNDT